MSFLTTFALKGYKNANYLFRFRVLLGYPVTVQYIVIVTDDTVPNSVYSGQNISDVPFYRMKNNENSQTCSVKGTNNFNIIRDFYLYVPYFGMNKSYVLHYYFSKRCVCQYVL